MTLVGCTTMHYYVDVHAHQAFLKPSHVVEDSRSGTVTTTALTPPPRASDSWLPPPPWIMICLFVPPLTAAPPTPRPQR